MAMWSSEELVQHIAQGSREALGELYDRHASVVRAVALAILREAEDADDVVQTVFVEAWRSAERYDARRGQPAAWLAALARRRALGRQLRHPRIAASAPQTLDRLFSS
jgi:RNA polymerase sigma-70 factor (ECF subfamily)